MVEDKVIAPPGCDTPAEATELWTFRRNLASRDPNWLLVETDQAEA